MNAVKEIQELELDINTLIDALDKAQVIILALRNGVNRAAERVYRCKKQMGLSASAPIRKRKKEEEVDEMANKILSELLSGKPLKKTINAKA